MISDPVSVVNLCGPSGCGKTTIIDAVAAASHPTSLKCKIYTMKSRASALVRAMGLDLSRGYGSIQSLDVIERLHYGIVVQHYEGLWSIIDRMRVPLVIATDRGPVDFIVNYDMHVAALEGRQRPSVAQRAASRAALLRLITRYRESIVGAFPSQNIATYTWLVPPLHAKGDTHTARGVDKIDETLSADHAYLQRALSVYSEVYGVAELPTYVVSPSTPDGDRIKQSLGRLSNLAA